MKINKIICDACNEEVDVEKDGGLAAFEYIQARQTMSFSPTAQVDPDNQLTKTSYDLCKNCADTVVEFIEKKKQDKKVEEVKEEK